MNALTRFFCVVLMCISGFGCSYPDSKVTREENRPSIMVVGAPDTATLEVDGINQGLASTYNGNPTTLLVETGAHNVRILDGNTILLSREVYVSAGETRSLTLKREKPE